MGNDLMVERVVAELQELILAAGLDPARWAEFPVRLASLYPGSHVALLGDDKTSGRLIGYHLHGLDEEFARPYEDYFHGLNPWLAVWHRIPVGRAATSNSVAPAELFERTEFYNDWLARHGRTCGAGVKIYDRPDLQALVHVNYGPKQAERYDHELEHIIDRLVPAFRAAVACNRQLAVGFRGNAVLSDVVGAIEHPCWIVDSTARIQLANPSGEAAALAGEIVTSRAGRLSEGRAGDRSGLRDAIRRATERQQPEAVVIREGGGRAFATIKIVPVGTRGTASGDWMFRPVPWAMVTVQGLRRAEPKVERLAAIRFGLTPAEARVAAQLATGLPISEIAERLGVSRETVRTHVKRAFEKTGCRRQTELAALLTALG